MLSEVSTRRGEIELEKGFENSFEFDCFSNFDFLDVTALNLPIKSFDTFEFGAEDEFSTSERRRYVSICLTNARQHLQRIFKSGFDPMPQSLRGGYRVAYRGFRLLKSIEYIFSALLHIPKCISFLRDKDGESF